MQAAVSAPQVSAPQGSGQAASDHIVDRLIAERAPRLAASPAWPLLKPALYALLDYRKARAMADAIAPLSGAAALQYVSDLLAVKVTAQGLERLPAQGRAIVVCNHPTGIADGLAARDAMLRVRRDLAFYANSDAHRVCPGLHETLIPVAWVLEKRTREHTRRTLELTRAALEAEQCLVIFPAGRISRRQPDGSLRDPPWTPSAVSLARRYDAPITPIHMSGPFSRLFHLFHRLSPELRDITLFHELLNKRGGQFTVTVGLPIAPAALTGETDAVTERLKAYVERDLPADPDRGFA